MIVGATRAVVQLFREIEPDVHLNMGGLTELASLPSIVLTGPSLTERGRAGRDAERQETSERTCLSLPGYVKLRWRNSILPFTDSSGTAVSESQTVFFSSRSAETRLSEALPREVMPISSLMASIGQMIASK